MNRIGGVFTEITIAGIIQCPSQSIVLGPVHLLQEITKA
jgi:hypothetical protein